MKSIYLKGVVGYDFDEESIRQQININSSEKLRVYINSPGGEVMEGFSIYNLFKQYKGKVETVIAPYAASAASYIAMAGDEISGFKNSVFMAHRAYGLVIGNANVLKTSAEIFDAFDGIIAESYSGRMGKSKDEVLKMLDSDLWLVGWEKLTDAGMLDAVLDAADVEEEVPEDVKKEITEEEPEETATKSKRKEEEKKINKCLSEIKNRNSGERLLKLAALCTNQPPETPADDIKKQEGSMTLQDFLKSNPDAQAEFDKALNTARASGEESVLNDRKRIADILNFSGVKLSAEAIDAIESGTEAKDFAADELLKERQIRANKKDSPFAKLNAKQVPGEQDPGGKKDAQDAKELEDAEFDKKIEASAEKHAKAGRL